MDHCLDPYIFFGRGIGLNYNPLALPFMRQMIWTQFPSFAAATLIQRMLPGNGSEGTLFLGISMNGYRLLATMLLSFVQWLLIALMLASLSLKFRKSNPRFG